LPINVDIRSSLLAALIVLALGAASARAGTWMQVSCVNPDGSAAPSEGWSAGSTGSPAYGSSDSAQCGPGAPMTAALSDLAPDPVGAAENLQYQPPSGSTLVGGTLDATLSAAGGGYNASGDDVMYEPAFVYPGSVFYQCAWGLGPCQNGADAFTGQVSLPADAGGDLYVSASCGGNAGSTCNSHPSNGAWAQITVASARLLLSSAATPEATGFSGSALQNPVTGTGQLVFTTTDTGGPGVYTVTTQIDGTTVWSGTPDTNDGQCAPVGTDPSTGALMFDHQQPCPETAVVDVPVPTTGLSDGPHELKVLVTDAAGNTSPVLDQTIITSNPQQTPVPTGTRTIHARFRISWRWQGPRTLLRSITVTHLPRQATLSVSCTGHGCPRLHIHHRPARHASRLLHELDNRTFTAGDRLLITITERHHRAERIQLIVQDNQIPLARLLSR
jgi:hypothetical protein